MMDRLKQQGFTMIELLVVIAVIGILAVALLATLNPLEQIRKGRDTRTRSDASQLVSGIERYNASLGYFPWQTGESNDIVTNGSDVPLIQINAGGNVAGCTVTATDPCPIADVLDQLTSTNEVKASFIDRITASTYTNMFLAFNDEITGASVVACFTPESNTFQREAFDRCKKGVTAWGTDFVSNVYGAGLVCPDGAESVYLAAAKVFDAASANEMICIP